jgi:RNA polymerase sigma-70 factor, ECF subfamily
MRMSPPRTIAGELDDVMRRVAQGDRAAFTILYSATSAKLYGIILRILKRRALADEVLQEVYVRIWNNAGNFDPARSSPITWMATIARNRALDEARKASPLSIEDVPAAFQIADPQMLASETLEIAGDLARLQACISALEPDKRDIVKLAYLEGLSREELASRFGHPVATIKTWLHRSLKQLKTCLTS